MRTIASLLLLSAIALGIPTSWLAERQDASGAWHSGRDADVGITALSVLAFLGEGYTDRGTIKENLYAANVRRGLGFLIRNPGTTARERAISTLALCEAYWMTGNPIYKAPAEQGLARLEGGDDPYTRAFVVAALKSGRHAKLAVPQKRFDREREWLTSNIQHSPAAGLFSAIFLASKPPREDELIQRAIKLLLREKPRDPWTWYFGTLGTFQVGGRTWKRWNESIGPGLLKTMRPGGSWDYDVETTALHLPCLSVYYRYDRVFGLGEVSEPGPTGPRGRSSLPPLTSRIELDSGGVLELEAVNAAVQVEGFRARVRLSLRFFHDGDDLDEGKFQLRLPDGASPHDLGFGSAAEPTRAATTFRMKSARMVGRKRARHAYTTITSERRDPALLEWDGDEVFTTRVFPLEPHKLHQVTIGYDIDLGANGEFELLLPKTKRPNNLQIGDEKLIATKQLRFVRTFPPVSVMTGGGYTAVRTPAQLPAGWTIAQAKLAGCTDVIFDGDTIAARGEATGGARLDLQLRAGDRTRTWTTTLPAPVASALTPRVYGEIAVAALEPFALVGEGLPEAYARHFRIVRATCSLVMLESEKDYERFGIRPKDDAGVVERVPAAAWLKKRMQATPKQRLRWRLVTAGRSTELLEQVPDSECAGLPLDQASFAELAVSCERRGRPRLGLVCDALSKDRRRESLCAQLLRTEDEGFWFDYARKALGAGDHDLIVVLHWDSDDSDVDLHVVDPFGAVCNWRRPLVGTGGRLTSDNMHGFGPDIFRLKQAEPGEYVIRVNYFRPAGVTRAHVVAVQSDKVVRASVELKRRDQMVEALRITIPQR